MLFYWIFEAILTAFALLCVATKGDWRVVVPFRAIIWFIIVFRFKTGFDWEFYQEYYASLLLDAPTEIHRFMEPGFVALNWALSRITPDIQVLFWLCSIAVLSAFWLTERLISRWVIGTYYMVVANFLLFSVFFSVVRQSLALALCLLAILAIVESQRLQAVALLILSPLFQIFGAVYSGIVLVAAVTGKWHGKALLGAYIAVAVLGRLAWWLAGIIQLPGTLGGRINYYAHIGSAGIDIETIFVFVLASAFIIVLGYRYFWQSSDDVTGKLLARIAMLTALMVLVVVDIEIIRNRLIYLLVPVAVIAMVRGVQPLVMGRIALVGLALGSGIYYFGWLKRETAYMLVPYHNYFAIALNLDRSTDRAVPDADARRTSEVM